ncbi:BREX-1 system adenine-specific DNA-methyltransferase PglX [Laribacter hongkongensis]|uniref:BREX-1 system adenine-specific DNA-methyltransferase PglX n=1 Tax=Laribacter hongkongensis TaxID=168471 RepID=UPI001EFD0A7D|nr:BREX-1 system adenine-specific DNA-methyltransferase PglX [Laribacter hongkongensis]MCG9118880.1 BREX-1 system adenine-specific DNA-methyltransferase PglX [Laribacter hongkongensis]
MNKSKLKSYAPQARKDFIAMVQSRAAQLGIAEVNGQLQVQPCEVQGQVAIIAGQAFPAKIANQRLALVARMQKEGFAATVDAIAYTWFNRFAALRYMELHNYLGHGQRVLSSVVEGGLPDILTHALELVSAGDLPGVSVDDVSQLKLAGKDGELYKRLLVAQCNQLAGHMGFLFERIDDDSELLLPDNLLRTDSVVRKLVDSIDEADWQQVEIIGWLYQFYISEKKDQVIGKVVKSADIPAATQLFTPNWIVKYLVQNSVGRLWLQANPGSTLASQMAYYIQPAEQTPEVNAQLSALVQARIAEDGDTLNPESITVLDPACGSGHILVEAYDLLKAIYLERGYRERDIPRLILQKNLFGLDIDDRAAQLAAFALLMKARADDRRLFNEPIQLNVLALQESTGLDAAQLAQELGLADASQRQELTSLLATFAQAKTFGSLLQVPPVLAQALPGLAASLISAHASGDLYAQSAAATLQPLLQQAQLLARQYDAVVANPPYMGSKGMNDTVKTFAKKAFPDSKSDLFAMFIERGFGWCKPSGFNSMVTMQSWMFLSSYEAMREKLLAERTLSNMVHMGNGVMGIAFGTAATVFWSKHVNDYEGSFSYCENDDVNEDGLPKEFPVRNERLKTAKPDDFKKIPGSPVAYWVSDAIRSTFQSNVPISKIASTRKGMATGDNARFVRMWHEVRYGDIGFGESRISASLSGKKWFPYANGGEYRKWAGNIEDVVLWQNDGQILQTELHETGRVRAVNLNLDYIFRPGITWTSITSGVFSARLMPKGCLFSSAANSLFLVSENSSLMPLLGVMNSCVFSSLSKVVNPTLNMNPGDAGVLPAVSDQDIEKDIEFVVNSLVKEHSDDWDSNETSWGFKGFDNILNPDTDGLVSFAWKARVERSLLRVDTCKGLEVKLNELCIAAFDLQNELTPYVSEDQITLTRADREKDMQRLVSYAIGCMMGRYSLDEPGLIYAHAGSVGFDPSRYVRFAADADGIVPVSDLPWFPDDATQRVKEFLVAVWGQDTLAENLAWLADSLGRKADESPEDALRRYISGSFFKDHCQTYKKRPIYWLFSSGKQKAFEALVYLHRYNDTTLARMRAEYVVPLTGRMAERIQLLEDDALKATTSASRKAIDKQIEKLKKKLEELRQYDEKLRHFADQRITLDLDDGVKVNYGKFGDLLDNVKGITGGAGDD